MENQTSSDAARNRRKSSAAVIALERAQHDQVDIIENVALLNEADRRLAELGYTQVPFPVPSYPEILILTMMSNVGLQARVFMAVLFLFRRVNFGPLRQCGYHVRVPTRSWRFRFCRLVLADLRIWGHVHSLVRVGTRFCIPDIRGSLLHLQIPCARGLGTRNQLAVWMVESSGTNCWSSLYRIWLRSIALGSRIHGVRV